jgi:hypothetical protein
MKSHKQSINSFTLPSLFAINVEVGRQNSSRSKVGCDYEVLLNSLLLI